ncbi:MAG: S8 family serine peptidase [Lachnospiraceae bacterium]|nr:S8 family serine peptidase [Lachnospiraceae bacterium]
MRRRWKRGRVILPLLLSAMMVIEPVGAASVVHAEELTDLVQDEDAEKNMEIVGEEEEQDADDTIVENPDQTDDGQEDKEDSKNEESGEEGSDSDSTDKKDESDENPSESDEGEDQEVEKDEEGELSEGDRTEEDTVSGNGLETEPEEDKDDELGDFSGMPDDYRLSLEQKDAKRVLADKASDISEDQEGIMYVKGEVMTLAASQKEAEMIAEAYNAKIKSFENGLLVLTLEKDTTVCEAIRAAASSRTLLPAVWPNYYRYAHVEETNSDNGEELIYGEADETSVLEAYELAIASYDDPDLSPNSDQYQWQHVAVGSPYAWKSGYTGEGVKVAVLDSGVATHSDITITGNANKTAASSHLDNYGHGTHVAGIIGAKSNSIGGAGIAPDAALYNIKVLNDAGSGTDDTIYQGIAQAIAWDVDVINMSLGGPGYNQLVQDIITEAYEERGIAIFVSAGNDGVSAINYPACYDGIICVAATDTNNVRADFSTYGSWVDLSAPGVNIYSTYLNDGYASMNGTSMACPVASGEAAVLLASHSSLKSMGKSKARVDALEKVMKSNAVKVSGSGMGKGVTSLTKAFKLTTASAKPQAPVIDIEYDTEEKQSVTVTITAPIGLTVYYTTNGKSPAFKNGEIDKASEAQVYSTPFSINDSAKVTIKAIAVNASGVSSAVKSATKALTPYVTKIEIDGVKYVAPGKSIQLSATVTPTYATNKKLDWQLQKDNVVVSAQDAKTLGVSINTSNGKVTATKNAQAGSYRVVAIAQDRKQIQATYDIEVITAVRVKSAKFNKKTVSIELPTAETYDLATDFVSEAMSAETTLSVTDFKWTSSNTTIAEVSSAGKVTPHKAGKVTITALANDSSGKKATCTVTITQQATKIEVSGASKVAVGKNVTFKAAVSPADTTNKKVTWQLIKDGKVVDAKLDKAFATEVGVSINASNGKVTASKNAKPGEYTVKAISMDNGKVESAGATITVISDVIDKFEFVNKKDASVTLYREKAASTTETQKDIVVRIKGKGSAGDIDFDAYTVDSSNKGIATVTATRSEENITLKIKATGNAAGSTKITLASTDGSNKKLVCTVKVVNPVSKIHIASNTITASYSNPKVDMCVVRNKSIQLKATLESEYGTVSNKNVTWSIDAPADSGVKISGSGKVTASKTALLPSKNTDGTWNNVWTVTATAKDNSGVKATYKVMAVRAATYVSAYKLQADYGRVKVFNQVQKMSDADGVQKFISLPISSDVQGGYIEASSSNKKIVEVTTNETQDGLYLMLTARQPGIAMVTLKATDGSGVKITYRIEVLD